ncbi:MAG: metal ABC transporter substrate-binding protein, partial [Oscillospiraceae bacterium]
NGGESDVWVENILESDDSKSLNTLRMMDSVEALEEEHIEGAEEHEHHDGEEEEYDEHIWTSPKNAAKIVASVRDAAIKLNPENSALYEQSANSYIAEINDLDSRFSRLLANERRYFIFGDRFPLLYFFKEYDLNYYAAFPGCGSETEPSAQMIAFLTEKLKQEDSVKTVFYIELSNHKLSDTLAKDTGVSTAEFHTCHNITADDFQAGETYVSLMERNYRMLEGVLA